MAITAKQFIEGIYVAYWGRAADPEGLGYWLGQYEAGTLDLAGIAENFASSDEGTDAYAYFNAVFNYPGYPISDSMRQTFIESIYQNLFDRAPDAEGLAYWTDILATGASSPGAFIANIINAAYEGREGDSADDWANLDAKIQIAEYYTDQIVELGITWTVEDNLLQATAVLEGIDADTDIDAAKLAVDDAIAGAGDIGQTLTFTTSAQDNLVGGTGDDIFRAEVTSSVQPSTTNTLTGGDKGDGLGGTDRVVITADSSTGPVNVTGFQLDNIEQMEIRAYGAAPVNLGLVNVPGASGAGGLTTVISTTSTADVTLDTVKNLVDLEMTGNGATASDFTVNYTEAALAGADDVQQIMVNGFGPGGNLATITINGAGGEGVETVEITAIGDGSTLEVDADAMQAITLLGDGDLDLSYTSTADVTDIDGSAMTGDLTIALDDVNDTDDGVVDFTLQTGSGDDWVNGPALQGDYSVTTNAGDDVILLTQGAGGANFTVDAGEGDNTVDVDGIDVTVTTGAGADDITADSDGDADIDAGAGDDVITLEQAPDADDILAGGEGTDALRVDEIADVNGDDAFAGSSSLEELIFAEDTSGDLNAADFVEDNDGTGANTAGFVTYTFEGEVDGATMLDNIVAGATVNLEDGTDAPQDITINLEAEGELTINVSSNAGADVDGAIDDGEDEDIDDLVLGDVTSLNLDFTDPDTVNDINDADITNTLTIDELTADSLVTLNISGTGHVVINDTIDNDDVLTTINAGTATGDIMLDVAADNDMTITTGSGDDFIGTVGGWMAGDDTVDLGEGDNQLFTDDGNDIITAGAGDDSIDAGAGDDVITAGDGDNDITGDDGDDSITTGAGDDLIDAGAGDDTVDAGAGDDEITAGTGVDDLVGGAGEDIFNFTYSTVPADQGLTSADLVKGGNADGSDDGFDDTVVITNGTDVTLVDDIFNGWDSVEVLDVSAATDTGADVDTTAGSVTLNAIAEVAGLQEVITGAGNDYVAIGEGFNSSLTVVLDAGDDTVAAGTAPADSTIVVEVLDANLTAGDDLTGGLGTADAIHITADDGAAVTDADEFESIVIVDGGDDDGDDGDGPPLDDDDYGEEGVSVTVTDAVADAGQGFIVDASALMDEDATFTFDGSDETNGYFILTGGAGDDVLVTGAGDDSIEAGEGDNNITAGAGDDVVTTGDGDNTVVGGDGDDTITTGDGVDLIHGGAGADVLNGGGGVDTFLITALDDSNTTESDTINGFVSNAATGEDFVAINDAILVGGPGTLNFAGNAANFGAAQGNTTNNDGLTDYVFQQDTNTLWIDLNDDGTLNADDIQINLAGVSSIEAGDVIDVTLGADALTITDDVVAPPAAEIGSLIVGGMGVTTLTFNGTNDISDNTLISVEDAVFAAGSVNTMTAAQYNAFDAITSADFSEVILTTAGTMGILEDGVSDYTLVGASSASVNGLQLDVNINGDTGNQTINIGGGAITGNFALGTGTDVLVATTGANITGMNGGGVTTAETLNLSGAITMTGTQHVFDIVAAGAGDSVTFTSVFTGNADADVEAYVLTDAANSIALAAVGQDVTGGTGNDVVVGGAFVTTASTLTAAAGTDTLTLTNDTATTDLDNVTGFEGIAIGNTNASSYTALDGLIAGAATLIVLQAGDQNLTWNGVAETNGILTITTSGGADVITLGSNGLSDSVSSGAGADTITIGTGDDSINAGAGNDTITGGANITAADTLTGGADTDTLTISGSATVTTEANFQTIEKVSWTDAGTQDTVTFVGQTESIELTLGDDVADAGADSFLMGGGNDTIVGGEKIDETFNETIDGGIGTDTVTFNGSFSDGIDGNLNLVENLVINTGGLTINLDLQTEGFAITGSTGADTIVNGLAGNDTITSGDGNDTITLGTGSDNVTTGNDTDTVIGAANVTTADTLVGGAGTDTLTLTDDTAVTDLDHVSGFETIAITSTSASLYTTVDALVASGETLTVTQAGAFALTWNGTAETDGAFNITANSGNDALTGGAGNDTFDSATGNDIIVGGNGDNVYTFNTAADLDTNDTVTGGTGTDTVNVTDTLVATDFNNATSIDAINLTMGAASALTATDALTSANAEMELVATGAFNLTLSVAAETNATWDITLPSGGTDTITLGAAHTVGNLGTTLVTINNAGAGDTVAMAGDGDAAVLVDLATFNEVTFAADVNTALFALGGAYAPLAETLILARIGGADSTDIYVINDLDGNNVNDTDALVHLVGTTRAIDGSMFS
ncbi:MAG: DUF4214 domain-containing protein [Pseudomonadota bacterium]